MPWLRRVAFVVDKYFVGVSALLLVLVKAEFMCWIVAVLLPALRAPWAPSGASLPVLRPPRQVPPCAPAHCFYAMLELSLMSPAHRPMSKLAEELVDLLARKLEAYAAYKG